MIFKLTTMYEVEQYLYNYISELSGGCDDFFEDIIIKGTFYKIIEDEKVIGVFSITNSNKLSCLYVEHRYRVLYERILDKVLNFNEVRGISTITTDSLMISEIIRRNYTIIKHAYNFKFLGNCMPTNIVMKEASPSDLEMIESVFGDFLSSYEDKIYRKELLLGYVEGELVSLGNIEYHTLNKEMVSIGIMVKEDQRYNGYGVETIKGLIAEISRKNLSIHAGCWYYNHASKKTLLKAGMAMTGILIRVDEL